MFVSRPLSMYRKSGSNISIPTSDGPYSGYLVITDEEAEAEDSYCWGILKNKRIKKLPFPQDKALTILHSTSQYQETNKSTKVWLIPVLDRPLSANRYYIIKAKGKHKGKAYKCAKEDEITRCCFGEVVSDRKPTAFNVRDIYQQFHIHRYHNGGFFAESVVSDAIPPKFLRTKGWKIRSSSSFQLTQHALGFDPSFRQLLPDFNFPIFTRRSTPISVGKWYCPFIFIREKSLKLEKQMQISPIYSLTLEQYWEEIVSCDNIDSESNSHIVTVAIDVAREVILISGKEAIKDETKNGFVWYKIPNELEFGRRKRRRKEVSGVGLSIAIVEKMKWVQEAGGWFNGEGERVVRVVRVEEITSENGWTRFSLYMLVESFVLRRFNGSLVWKCNFKHTHNIRCKWE